MPNSSKKHSGKLSIWEILVIAIAVVIGLSVAVGGRGRKIRGATERFFQVAPQVQEALEAFAADHQGRFPPDGMLTGSPKGIDGKYIDWDRTWNLDYEVHDNGKGGKYICLEWCGPFTKPAYHGLCNNPEYRRKYGKGQEIPNSMSRIWVIRESAPVMPDKTKPPEKQ